MNSMTHQERGDVMFNFAYLLEYSTKITFAAFADVIESNNTSQQAKCLVSYLRSNVGMVSRDDMGLTIQDWLDNV
jgi:hypothetical protein